MALRQSRAGVIGRFGAFRTLDASDEQEQYEDNDHEAMRSSWVPPRGRQDGTPRGSEIRSSSSGSESPSPSIRGSVRSPPPPETSHKFDSDDEDSRHNEAPDDVMFGVSLGDSIPPASLAGSPPMKAAGRPYAAHGFVNTGLESYALENSLQNSGDMQKSISPERLVHPGMTPIYHDSTFAILFMLCQASLFATSVAVYFRTDIASTPVADSIYYALNSSMSIVIKDVFIALAIATVWLVVMRSFVKSLLYTIIIAVPIVLFTISFYSLAWSYKGQNGGYEIQARAMRWSSFITAIFASMWLYTTYTRRYAMTKAVAIVRLACIILEHNSFLVLLSFVNLLIFVLYCFLWLQQFERIFLRGAFIGVDNARRWLLDGSSWAIGVYFILVFLWTFGIFSGVQRSATGAVVSQWYFHRHTVPATSQKEIVKAGLLHALSSSFGTICASSFFALMTRLPLLALPRRASGLLSLAAYMLLSAPIFNLTSPLTLTYASIHSIPIRTAAQGINGYPALSTSGSWGSYRTAKMLLSAARATTALALGSCAWIASARSSDGTGSLYGYVVGLAAGAIGWAVVGAVEGTVSMVVDSSFVCYNIDLANAREGRSRCLEAVNAFGSGRGSVDGTLQV